MNKIKKRIIFFLPNFSSGGAADSLVKLSEFLVKKNFSILIISIGENFYKQRLKKNNCDIIELKSKRAIFSIFEIRKLLFVESKKKYKKLVFISNIHYGNIVTILSSIFIKNFKIILTERSSLSELKNNSTFKNKLIYSMAKYLYKFSNLVIVNSKFEEKYIRKNFNLRKVISIHPPSISKINSKVKKKSNKNFLKIIFVGRLSREKGINTILTALSKVKQKLKFKFSIYGNGPEKNNIINLIKILNLKEHVELKGFEKNKNKIFKNRDLFINASHFEGLPNAMVQAINFNVFPICSNAPGGNMEVINFGEFGMSFKLNDENDLEKKIIKFFNSKLSFNVNKKIKHLEKFTEKRSFKKYLEVLDKI